MARTLVESSITTRNARAALEIGIHWRGIDPEVHLGYRKGKRGGAWLVRWRSGRGYRQSPLGTADDELQAGTLSYEAARKAARVLVEGARIEVAATAGKPALDVRHVIEDHISMRDARESKRQGRVVRSDASRRLARHILGQPGRGKQPSISTAPLASISLYSLKESDLLAWREALPVAMKFTTKQRLINDLKSALNSAYATHRERLDPTLPAVIKHGLKLQHEDDELAPVARENQILSDETIGRLLTAARDVDLEQEWDGDLFRLMVILAATGARFSQIQRMRVADCQAAGGRLLVPVSRKGRGGKTGAIPVPVGHDVFDALKPVATGRHDDARLLERWHHKQIAGGISWERAERGAWRSASELAKPWQAIRDRAQLPGVIPYAFRHSSIVRGIRANLPIRLVAALHDTSVLMVERHYGRWIADGLEELAARAVVPLVPLQRAGANVISIKAG